LSKYHLGENRVRSTRQFRKYVTSHEYPVIVLYRKKESQQCQQVEHSLKKELIKSKGKFRLCILDEDLIEEKLQSLMQFSMAPSVYIFYRASIVQEHYGVPSRQVLKGLIKTVQSLHYLANEEIIMSQLLKQGQAFIEEKKWSEAIGAYEEAEKMDKWSEIYGSQICSSLSLAYAQIGNITKAKHFMQLYRESTADFGQQALPDDVDGQ
jgi:thioredoxin-like negative regulator of GroEL